MAATITDIVKDIHKKMTVGLTEMIIWKADSEIEKILFMGVVEKLREMYPFIEADYKDKTIIFIKE